MTYKDAVSVAEKMEPSLKTILVSEQDDQFLLLMSDETGLPLMNSSVIVVNKKSGKCEWVNTMLNFKMVNKPILKEYSP